MKEGLSRGGLLYFGFEKFAPREWNSEGKIEKNRKNREIEKLKNTEIEA